MVGIVWAAMLAMAGGLAAAAPTSSMGQFLGANQLVNSCDQHKTCDACLSAGCGYSPVAVPKCVPQPTVENGIAMCKDYFRYLLGSARNPLTLQNDLGPCANEPAEFKKDCMIEKAADQYKKGLMHGIAPNCARVLFALQHKQYYITEKGAGTCATTKSGAGVVSPSSGVQKASAAYFDTELKAIAMERLLTDRERIKKVASLLAERVCVIDCEFPQASAKACKDHHFSVGFWRGCSHWDVFQGQCPTDKTYGALGQSYPKYMEAANEKMAAAWANLGGKNATNDAMLAGLKVAWDTLTSPPFIGDSHLFAAAGMYALHEVGVAGRMSWIRSKKTLPQGSALKLKGNAQVLGHSFIDYDGGAPGTDSNFLIDLWSRSLGLGNGIKPHNVAFPMEEEGYSPKMFKNVPIELKARKALTVEMPHREFADGPYKELIKVERPENMVTTIANPIWAEVEKEITAFREHNAYGTESSPIEPVDKAWSKDTDWDRLKPSEN